MQQALEALQRIYIAPEREEYILVWWPACEDAITALRERLAQPEQEPVAHTLNCVCGAVWDIKDDGSEEMVHTPDATPQQRQWHSLTDEEIDELSRSMVKGDKSVNWLCQAIEAKLKEKNHG